MVDRIQYSFENFLKLLLLRIKLISMLKVIYKLPVLCLLVISNVIAQAQPFISEIKNFKKQDSISFPPKEAILFVGSSSFNFWKDVQDYFPGYTIINRGFGGSSIPDVIRY